MTPADMLEAGAAWLDTHEWTQRQYARGAKREKRSPVSKHAVCWCGEGAIRASAPKATQDALAEANHAFADFDGNWLCNFNDAPGRTKAEVIAAMREAAAAWRAQNVGREVRR